MCGGGGQFRYCGVEKDRGDTRQRIASRAEETQGGVLPLRQAPAACSLKSHVSFLSADCKCLVVWVFSRSAV